MKKKIAFGVACLFIVGVAVFLHFFTWNKMRPLIARQSRAWLGRELLIAGDLDLHLALVPRLTMNDVSFENAPWAGDAPLFSAKHLEVSVALLPLLKRRLELPVLHIVDGAFNFARRADGTTNVALPRLTEKLAERQAKRAAEGKLPKAKKPRAPEPADWLPVLADVAIQGFQLNYADQATGLSTKVHVDQATSAQSSLKDNLHVLLAGYLSAHLPSGSELAPTLFRLEATGGSLLDVKVDSGWPVRLEASLGDVNLAVNGRIDAPRELRGVDVRVAGSARGLGPLLQSVGVPVGVVAPIKLKGRLRGGGKDWQATDIDLSLGDSRALGSFSVRDDDRLSLAGDLRSPFLDIDDIKALFPPKPPAVAARTAVQPAAAKPADAKPEPLFSSKPFALDGLRSFDLDLALQVQRLIAAADRHDILDDGTLQAHLHGGDLRIPKLAFTDSLGRFLAAGHFDARGPELISSVTLDAAHIDVGRLIRKLTSKIAASQEEKIAFGKRSQKDIATGVTREAKAVGRDTYGELGGRAQLSSRGNSPKAMIDHLQGPIGVALQNGHISDVLTFLAELDIGKAIASYWKGDQGSDVDCLIASFIIANGDGKADTLLLVNKQTNLIGAGDVNLAAETIDLRFTLHPKKISFDSLRAPLTVTGPLRSPKTHFDTKPIIARVGAAIALGAVITPPAAVLAFVDAGLGKKNLCSQHLNELAKLQPLKKGEPATAH